MAATLDESRVTHRYADVDGLRLHYVEAGTGPLVLMLHGFPEFWYSWQHQILPLADAGFHVVAPDMPGYNLSDKPRDVRAYGAGAVAADVRGLMRACGAERASVVGHDFGGAVAWQFAMSYPEALDRLVVMNAPHPVRFSQALRSPRQAAKSSYMLFYQIPRVPEAVLRAGDFALLRQVFKRDPVHPDAFSAEDIDRRIDALKQPGALTAALNYYRAIVRSSAQAAGPRPIDAPVLVIWGERDRYLGRELAEPPRDLVPHARVEYLPDASHWVQSDQAERVTALLLDFLAAGGAAH